MSALSRWLNIWTSSFSGAISSTVAPASSSAWRGFSYSTCSTPSFAVRMAIFLPCSSLDMPFGYPGSGARQHLPDGLVLEQSGGELGGFDALVALEEMEREIKAG